MALHKPSKQDIKVLPARKKKSGKKKKKKR